MQYLVSVSDKKLVAKTEEYVFTEERDAQELLAYIPEIILDIPDLEIEGGSAAMSFREVPTGNGNIDVLYLTPIGEIVIVETKLVKNPEATRTVIAQVIDYVKGLSNTKSNDFMNRLGTRKVVDQPFDVKDESFEIRVREALRRGYFKVVVFGDFIHPNVLGMVESIQAAPHLSFTIFLVEANARIIGDSISISPRVVAKTKEIERSVIKIDVNVPYTIQAETPQTEENVPPGNSPKKSFEEYISTVTKFKSEIISFYENWEARFPGTYSPGQVGFSVGVNFGGKRIPVQFVYNNRLKIVSQNHKSNFKIPDDLYDEYTTELQKIPMVYDICIAGKAEVLFDSLNADEVDIIFSAAVRLAENLEKFVQ